MIARASFLVAILAWAAPMAAAQQPAPVDTVSLSDVLAKTGASSLDIALAREAVEQAKAQDLQATWRFFPYLSVGGQYAAHTGGAANVNGVIIDADKDLSTLNGVVTAQLDLGEAIPRKMIASERRVGAAAQLDAQKATTIRNAAWAYFDLVGATAEVGIQKQAVATSQDYLDQINRAVEIGLAARAEVLRVQADLDANQILLRQAQEKAARAGAALAETLRTPVGRTLAPAETVPVAVRLTPADQPLQDMLASAMERRPELAQSRSEMKSAKLASNSAAYGPLLPNITAQYGASRLHGGPDGLPSVEKDATDAQVLFTWKLGPGGLFDTGRIDEAKSLERRAGLQDARLRDAITREVVEAREALMSAQDQMMLAQTNVDTATRSLDLARQRREFGIAAVLEAITAQQQVVTAQRALAQAVTQQNKAQYAVARAVGALD